MLAVPLAYHACAAAGLTHECIAAGLIRACTASPALASPPALELALPPALELATSLSIELASLPASRELAPPLAFPRSCSH
jgi:hypothetical protein